MGMTKIFRFKKFELKIPENDEISKFFGNFFTLLCSTFLLFSFSSFSLRLFMSLCSLFEVDLLFTIAHQKQSNFHYYSLHQFLHVTLSFKIQIKRKFSFLHKKRRKKFHSEWENIFLNLLNPYQGLQNIKASKNK